MLVAGGLGLVVGVAAGLAFRLSERDQRGSSPPQALEQPGDGLDEGVARVLAVLPSSAVVVTTDGRVVRASGAAYAHGLVREDRVTHEEVQRLLLEVARDGEIRDVEVELSRGPLVRTPVPFRLRIAPLGMSHVLLLAEDLTQARRLDAVRRDFVVNASHELKTPVGALGLLAETIGQAADDPEAVRRFAGRIEIEALRLSALVQDILQLSRVQVGVAPTDMVPVKVGAVVGEAADRARTTAEARSIAIDVAAEDAEVLGDHDLLVTVVRNLLDNAVSYSDPGTRIGVGVTVRDEVVEISVVDQGIGIPADALPRVFERFYRVDPARSRDTGGTGLGLSIVKHVVADHGGEVTVWSEPGRGSTFTVRLPLAPSTEGTR